jgi:hypothetical protein
MIADGPYVAPELNPPTTRIGRLAQGFIDRLQRRLLAASAVGPGPFFPPAIFPWIPELEAATPAIRQELESLLPERSRLPSFQDITPEVGTITADDRWKTFMFMGYGLKSEANLARCPETARPSPASRRSTPPSSRSSSRASASPCTAAPTTAFSASTSG